MTGFCEGSAIHFNGWNVKAEMAKGETIKQGVRLGRAAAGAGVSRQTVQYYLMVGLIEPSGFSAGGQQLFDEKTIERIRLIKELNDTGYPLREIREIFLQREKQMGEPHKDPQA
jgi:DNA-binding transcriptional MerR regulator